MGRWVVLSLVLGLAAGCDSGTGYRRPAQRDIGAIGAPAVSVGTYGLDHGKAAPGSVQDQRSDMAPFTGEHSEAFKEPAGGAGQVGPQRLTLSGQLYDVKPSNVVIQTNEGETLELGLRSMTSVTIDGMPSSLRALPEGADVRAAYVQDGAERYAERLDVRTNDKKTRPVKDMEDVR